MPLPLVHDDGGVRTTTLDRPAQADAPRSRRAEVSTAPATRETLWEYRR